MSIYEMVNIYYYYLSSEITKSLPGDNQHRLKGRENPVGAEGYFRQGVRSTGLARPCNVTG